MPLRIPRFLGPAAGAAALEEILGWILDEFRMANSR